MKIAFWSPIHGQAGTTSNALSIAIYIALHLKHRTLITQTNFHMNHLEKALLGDTSVEANFFQDVGIDALVRSIKTSPLDQDTFYDATISLLQKKLDFLSGTTKSNQTFYETDIEKVIGNIFHYAQEFYDLIVIDTNAGKNGFTPKVLDCADIIVINLCQNKLVLETFFKEYSFSPKKAFYLIGNYDKGSKYNITNLRNKYKCLTSHNSATIPYCTEFLDSYSEGGMIDFFQRNLNTGKEDHNFYFVNDVKKAAAQILRKGGWKGEIV